MSEEKLNYGKTFIIGLGFFTTGVSWALYNSYMPIFLRDYISSSSIIGFIMALDNILALFFYPIIGAFSDRVRTRIGRRMPFIVIGIPVSAFFFALLPFDKTIASLLGYSLQGDLTAAFVIRMLLVMFFIAGMTIYRSPVVALMPDVTPHRHRSTANGVINLMGGVGAVFAYGFGSMMYGVDRALPFIVTSVIMIASLILMYAFIKEPKVPPVSEDRVEKVKIVPAMKEIFTEKDKSALFILLAILLWFMSYNAIESWFTTYATKTLVKSEKIVNLNKTEGWMASRNDATRQLEYRAPSGEVVPLSFGDRIVFLSEKQNNQSIAKETIVLKDDTVIVLQPGGAAATIGVNQHYKIPYKENNSITLAQNGNTLLVEDGLERNILELPSRFTLSSPEKCPLDSGAEFCREVKENEASFALTLFSLMFLLVSIPAGFLSIKIGRKRTIMAGISGLVAVLVISLFVKNITVLTYVLALGGVFWAFININSITMVWEIATDERLGTYTGVYYFFSQTAQIAAPVVFGMFFDMMGYSVLFPTSIAFMVLALVCMSRVRKGEYEKGARQA